MEPEGGPDRCRRHHPSGHRNRNHPRHSGKRTRMRRALRSQRCRQRRAQLIAELAAMQPSISAAGGSVNSAEALFNAQQTRVLNERKQLAKLNATAAVVEQPAEQQRRHRHAGQGTAGGDHASHLRDQRQQPGARGGVERRLLQPGDRRLEGGEPGVTTGSRPRRTSCGGQPRDCRRADSRSAATRRRRSARGTARRAE